MSRENQRFHAWLTAGLHRVQTTTLEAYWGTEATWTRVREDWDSFRLCGCDMLTFMDYLATSGWSDGYVGSKLSHVKYVQFIRGVIDKTHDLNWEEFFRRAYKKMLPTEGRHAIPIVLPSVSVVIGMFQYWVQALEQNNLSRCEQYMYVIGSIVLVQRPHEFHRLIMANIELIDIGEGCLIKLGAVGATNFRTKNVCPYLISINVTIKYISLEVSFATLMHRTLVRIRRSGRHQTDKLFISITDTVLTTKNVLARHGFTLMGKMPHNYLRKLGVTWASYGRINASIINGYGGWTTKTRTEVYEQHFVHFVFGDQRKCGRLWAHTLTPGEIYASTVGEAMSSKSNNVQLSIRTTLCNGITIPYQCSEYDSFIRRKVSKRQTFYTPARPPAIQPLLLEHPTTIPCKQNVVLSDTIEKLDIERSESDTLRLQDDKADQMFDDWFYEVETRSPKEGEIEERDRLFDEWFNEGYKDEVIEGITDSASDTNDEGDDVKGNICDEGHVIKCILGVEGVKVKVEWEKPDPSHSPWVLMTDVNKAFLHTYLLLNSGDNEVIISEAMWAYVLSKEDEVFLVDKVINHRRNKHGMVEYHVVWVGYEERTWEALSNSDLAVID
jgi:hypothetical protein